MLPKTCSIPECESARYCRGWCKKHYSRWQTHGDPLKVIKQTKSPCSIEGCETLAHAHGFCASHLYHSQTYGDPLAKGPGRHSGRRRMDQPSYTGMHKRLFYDKGRASAHACVECGKRAKEWSYDGGCPNEIFEVLELSPVPYSTDQTKYSPRCIKCHRAKDLSGNRNRSKDGRFANSALAK